VERVACASFMILEAEHMQLVIFTEPQQGASYDDQRRIAQARRTN